MSDYLAHEGLEHAEKAHEHVQGTSDPLLRFIPVVAAILAVCAGLSSLYGNRLGERILKLGNEAVLDQTRASDTWAEYQADSLKAHINAGDAAVAGDAAARSRLLADEARYRKRQGPLKIEADMLEAERSAALAGAGRVEAEKLDFDVATAVFQISIVLASIAAMTKRPPLFMVALIGGAIGIAFCVIGLLR